MYSLRHEASEVKQSSSLRRRTACSNNVHKQATIDNVVCSMAKAKSSRSQATSKPRTRAARRAQRPRAPRLDPALRRQHLLECALRVFARRGLGEARHAEIAREGKVALATVFVYFPTRAALVDAVLDEVARFYVDMARRIHARQELRADQVLLEHAREFSDSVANHEDYARISLDWSTSIRERVWPRYLKFQQEVADIIAATIRRGQREGSLSPAFDARFAALFLIGGAHIVAQLQFSHQPAEVLDGFLRALVDTIASGLSASSDEASRTIAAMPRHRPLR
jgi:TetR/AcrR family hemagglutinin/protease transcriptional regulator